jgi:type IV pilus assembly protein PilY1
MKRHILAKLSILLSSLGIGLGSFVLPLSALAATVALATSPLATSTTTAVKPNLLFILDNSGSMQWDHMPDDDGDPGSDVSWNYGYYGIRSSQCNQVYYDPNTTYDPPVNAAGTSFGDASFTAAYGGSEGGYASSPTTVNLDTSFQANQTNTGGNAGGTDTNGSAYYYAYSGTQDTQSEKYYHSTSNTFYSECNSAFNASPGRDVFAKRRLSSSPTTNIVVSATSGTPTVTSITVCTQGSSPTCTANLLNATASGNSNNAVATSIAAQINAKTLTTGYTASASTGTVTITPPTNGSALNRIPVGVTTGTVTLTTDAFPDTSAAKLTNFANWYSYYRTRMLMMKTATGLAFSHLNKNYRVGLMKISATTPVVALDTFWDNTDTSLGPVSTHRTDWYAALYAMNTSGSTPLRRALSDAGLYYAGQLSGTDPVQYSCQQNFSILSTDGYWNSGDGYLVDGSTAVGNQDGLESRPMYDGAGAIWTKTYSRTAYQRPFNGSCPTTGRELRTRLQTGSCSVTTSTASCTPSNSSWTDVSSSSACTLLTSTPAATAPVFVSSVQDSTGGSSDGLADVAEYYYKTDLRTPALGNCGTVVPPATEGPLCENNVFRSATDSNLQQHMTTFTLGLGASGWMNYKPGYSQNGTAPDFDAVRLGSTASSSVCTWQTSGTVCNWPLPGMTSGSDGYIANIDDLWHAAVNGRGSYFSATNPETLSTGLAGALAGIDTKRGAAAAAATSTLNPVAGNNFAYVASYTTVEWKGNLEARGINTDTGVVSESASWCVEDVTVTTETTATCTASGGSIVAQTNGDVAISNCERPVSDSCSAGIIECSGNTTSCDNDDRVCKVQVPIACSGTFSRTKTSPMISAASDTRTIKTANSTGTALIDFDAAYATANPTHFDATKLAGLSQWVDLTSGVGGQRATAVGANLVKYLRGQYGYEADAANAGPPDNRLYRKRTAVLGDALESQPSFIGKPVFSYPYPGYSEFKTAQASRTGTVYMGANDGMMHAFASATGVERWAYVPSMVIPNMWKLADINYATSHVNYVNGSPITSDICVTSNATALANCNNSAFASTVTTSDDPVWKTILVGGLNGGGRGYYALDITNPSTPVLLWEFTTTAGIGKVQDADLGYSYGQPVITKRADGKWVVLVTSGYNNVSPGDGRGYLYVLDANDGTILSKISTGEGDTTTPSGLAKIAGWNEEPPGNSVRYVYGGDLKGNVWKFDISSATVAVIGTGSALKFATLFSTTTGAAGDEQPIMTTPVLGKISGSRVVFIGTGKYLETGDLITTQKQTQYAIRDDNSGVTFVNPRNQGTLMVQQTMSTNTSTGTRSVTPATTAPNFYTGRGWFVDLPDTGERVNIDSQLAQGVLLAPSIVPSNTACAPGGTGWLNFFDYKTGAAVTASGIVSAKYDSTIVGVNVIYIDGEPVVEVVTSTNPTPKKDDDVTFPPTAGNFSGKRTLWRELMQ